MSNEPPPLTTSPRLSAVARKVMSNEPPPLTTKSRLRAVARKVMSNEPPPLTTKSFARGQSPNSFKYESMYESKLFSSTKYDRSLHICVRFPLPGSLIFLIPRCPILAIVTQLTLRTIATAVAPESLQKKK